MTDKTKPTNPAALTKAARDVLAERLRQQEIEGFEPDQDDLAQEGQIAAGAACYALWDSAAINMLRKEAKAGLWPWDESWWNPKDPRRNLVRAAALLLAEIERLDRAGYDAVDQPETF